jgi:ABC-type lipoprotein release transport system permease subunit
VLRLALSYLFRRPVQLLAVLGVAVGLLALLVVLAVMNGLIEMNRSAVRGPLSDLMMVPAATEELPRWEVYRDTLAPLAEVEAVAPRLVAFALVDFPAYLVDLSDPAYADFHGVELIGIDVADEAAVTGFNGLLADARRYPVADPADPFRIEGQVFPRPGVLVPDEFAARMPPSPEGRRLELEFATLPAVLPAAGEELQPHNAVVQVAGSYRGGDFRSRLDRIYMPRTGIDGLHYNLLGSAAADFTEVLIRLAPGVETEEAKTAILAALAAAGLPEPGGPRGGSLETWEERSATFLTAIENERRIVTLVLFFIVVVAGFGLFATLSALVREKVRDLGVLAAVGYSPTRRGMLLLLTGGVATASGVGLGLLGAWQFVRHRGAIAAWMEESFGIVVFPSDLYVVDGLPAEWIPGQVLGLTLVTFLVGLLFTAAPALRAALLSPVKALRYE